MVESSRSECPEGRGLIAVILELCASLLAKVGLLQCFKVILARSRESSPGEVTGDLQHLVVGGQALPPVPGQHLALPTPPEEDVPHHTDTAHLTAAPEHVTRGLRSGHVPQTNVTRLLAPPVDSHQSQRILRRKLYQCHTLPIQEGNLNRNS